MSEKIPERIEREMFEIRNQMDPDMTDLRKHIEPQVVAEQVKQTIRQRLQAVLENVKANLKAKQQEVMASGKRQLSLAREAGEQRDPAPSRSSPSYSPSPCSWHAR